MANFNHVLAALALSAGVVTLSSAQESVSPFRLPSVNAIEVVELQAGASGVTVLCFLGTECPIAKLYGGRLAKLSQRFADKEVRFIGISSNRQDSAEEFASFAKAHRISFEMAKDHRNVVADQCGVGRIPAVLVLDDQLSVCYRGRIDDQYDPGISRAQPQEEYLVAAIEQLLAGESVSVAKTEPVGCLLGRVREQVASSEVTYCEHAAPVFQQHCVECHRHGEIGPFELTAMTDYEEITGWADMIVEVIDNGRMPPWHAHPEVGSFRNSRVMPEQDKQTLRQWVEAGMPFGDPEKLPAAKKFTSGWRLDREPDLILSMSDHPFHVPAEGTVEYQYFVVDPGFEEDRWVKQVQVLPGNARVLHHSIVFIRPPDGEAFQGVGWLGGYVPGQRAVAFPPNSAIRIPAGSKLVFQQHYTPTGTAEEDTTQIAMLFADADEVTRTVYSVVGIDQEFEIPPEAAAHVVRSEVNYLPEDATLLTIMPHMHLRGKSFELWADGTSGAREKLLEVPAYDFNWQHSYQLTEPLPLANVDAIDFAATFDNSDSNPFNPDPKQYVTWGDQTWEEMAVVFLTVSEPREPAETETETDAEDEAGEVAEAAERSPELLQAMAAEADRILSKFDLNNDQELTRHETPLAFRFGFWNLDSDRNGRLTREELEEAAYVRLR